MLLGWKMPYHFHVISNKRLKLLDKARKIAWELTKHKKGLSGRDYNLGQARSQIAQGLGRLESSMNSFETRRTDLRRMVRTTGKTTAQCSSFRVFNSFYKTFQPQQWTRFNDQWALQHHDLVVWMILLGRGLGPRHTQAHMDLAQLFMAHVHKQPDVKFRRNFL